MKCACNIVHDGVALDLMVLTLPLASSTDKEDENTASILAFQEKF
jgi:hypothetical protein